ncbi:hypothetical protein SEPCBS119000_002849 [Sporothrix epigloea]|uniref:HAUS augmin-like complex subunit 6 N-terminal domain-containing protein n=1 Tax=Sporothrix epigloea TaxID=1892477 RepID=A0ABP0DJP8_9PEZI
MATVSSTSLLSRTRSGRLPSGKLPASRVAVTVPHAPSAPTSSTTASTPTSTSTLTSASTSASSNFNHIFPPASNVTIFLTNLHLLDLDLLPDWPGISARTFASKDAASQSGQKHRIQSVEWALYHLFCLYDPREARTAMQPLFPPSDQVQSVALRAAFLRGLETAKKAGALGRDAILRKTMLDECRGERFEEILAVFSSAVLKGVVEREDGSSSLARSMALENCGYSADRTQLYALILAHKTSLHQRLRQKEAARARYHDFEELLSLKERSVARRQELARAQTDAADKIQQELTGDRKVQLQRLVRNNWSGTEGWMQTLVYGDERTNKDGLLSAPTDRVWRRVQAGRVSELESQSDNGLLDQLEWRVTAQYERLKQWREYSQHVLQKQPQSASFVSTSSSTQATETNGLGKSGIDFGFDAHKCLNSALSTSNIDPGQQRNALEDASTTLQNDDYATLLKSFQGELAAVHQSRRGSSQMTSFLDNTRRMAAASSKAAGYASPAAASDDGNKDVESDISDMEEHPVVQQQQQQLSAPPSEDGVSPTRRRVLLTKSSMTFSVQSFHSDDESSPPREPSPPKFKRAATIRTDQPLAPAVRKLSGPTNNSTLALRRRQRSPPIRPPRAAATPPPAPRTPTPDRSPPPPTPPSDDDAPFELVATPQHSITLQPPPASDAASSAGASPTQDLADQILASMNNSSPSPIRRPRHTLSLAERTRMSMARTSWVGGGPHHMMSDDEDEWTRGDKNTSGNRRPDTLLVPDRQPHSKLALHKGVKTDEPNPNERAGVDMDEDPDGLIARTRKSMAGFEAARQKAQLDRKRLTKKSRQSSLGVAGVGSTLAKSSTAYGYFSPVNEAGGDELDEQGDTTFLAEELMSGGQDDPEAIFRSRPKIKMSPIPSPTRELEYEYEYD